MANEEHLGILKQGVEVWNKWREEIPDVRPDLSGEDLRRADLQGTILRMAVLRGADFHGANLNGADLREADLHGTGLNRTDLRRANLQGAILSRADLYGADLKGADLHRADLRGAELNRTNLQGANLQGAKLSRADFYGADLNGANLQGVNLHGANLNSTLLRNTNLDQANLNETTFGNVDLSTVNSLDKCKHHGPSTIDHRTLEMSGKLPLAFLRGCGLPDQLIEYLPSLRNDPFQFYSCFISYSHKNEDFTKRLHADLQDNGVRCWFAQEDLRIGDKTRHRIDDSIRMHDKLLLILSEDSIASNWVEYEAERAVDQERKRGGTVLFPIMLDDAIMKVEGTWADHIRDRHIGDFRKWKDHDSYQESFERLMRDLKAEAKNEKGSANGE